MSYRCESCHGLVASPDGRRLPPERLKAAHDRACPGHGVIRKDEEEAADA